MLSLKTGVDVGGIQPEVLLGLEICHGVFTRLGMPLVVTACLDGKHMTGSKHYVGQAVDMRLPSKYSIEPLIDVMVQAECRVHLGLQYDLVLEKDHLHLEYDPKKDIVL